MDMPITQSNTTTVEPAPQSNTPMTEPASQSQTESQPDSKTQSESQPKSQFQSPLGSQPKSKPFPESPRPKYGMGKAPQWKPAGSAVDGKAGDTGFDGPKPCPRCSQTVYHAEQVVALGKKWHKRCMKCDKCSKSLEANMNERNGKPYCGRCYDTTFGTGAQGFVLRPGVGTR